MQPPTFPETNFSTSAPITLLARPAGQPGVEWVEIDRGEGMHTAPAGHWLSVRVHNIDDGQLAQLVKELAGLPQLIELNLSENRKITDAGMKFLPALASLISLNLSSCSITGRGLAELTSLRSLERLDLSFCNRIIDVGLRAIKDLPRLNYLNVQGCVKLTNAGLVRLNRKGLTIYRR